MLKAKVNDSTPATKDGAKAEAEERTIVWINGIKKSLFSGKDFHSKT